MFARHTGARCDGLGPAARPRAPRRQRSKNADSRPRPAAIA
jgi:hypothetical protein